MLTKISRITLVTIQCKEKIQRRPAWYKAENDQLNEYTANLDSKLKTIDIPERIHSSEPNCKNEVHSKDRDKYMLDILSTMIETSYSVIPLSGGGGRKWDPDKNCPIGTVIPLRLSLSERILCSGTVFGRVLADPTLPDYG